MKKIIAVIAFLFFLGAMPTSSFAMLRKDMKAARGEVVLIDRQSKKVTIKENGKDITYVVTGMIDPAVQKGSNVLIIYKAGTNSAKSVKTIKRK